jgi:hypothetical protein
MQTIILQIEIIEPQGDKLLWLLLVIITIVAFLAFKNKKWKKIHLYPQKRNLQLNIKKNKTYHPTVLHFEIKNKTNKALDIENPVIRFKKGRKSKAYKIKAVNTRTIYPLFLDKGETHHLPVTLEPFYQHNQMLKKFSMVRFEFTYNKNKYKKSTYILLKPTLFRSAR